MDLSLTPTIESRTKPSLMITSALVSAVLEWILIFLLFINASFSYLATKFARYCQLQVPCLLCSRLDHVLGDERAGFYWELICRRHKSMISSLIFCQLHDNLVDIHGTCESCLFSFAMTQKSNSETYRLLIGKLHDEPYYDSSQATSSNEHNSRNCTCCNEQWIPRMCNEKLFNMKLLDSGRAKVNGPSSSTSKCNVEDEEAMEGSLQRDQACNKDTEQLPQVEYQKVKVISGYESEGPFSENESANVHFRETETLGDDSADKHVPPEPKTITLDECPALEKSIHLASLDKPLLSKLDESSDFARNAESEELFGHGLEERNCQPADCKLSASEKSKLISIPEAVASPSINRTHHEEPKDIGVSIKTELEKEVHVECGEVLNTGNGLAGTPELQKEFITKCGETSTSGNDCILKNEIQSDSQPNKTDASTQIAESLDLGDAYKLAVGARGRQLSGRLLEQQRSMSDSTRASEDLKLFLSQISAARGIDFPLYDMSPRVSANSEDFKTVDASGFVGMQILQRRISLERNESNLSFDGSVVSEIEGESVADRLKRQVEHDKKIMSALYKELEEERNASAIAVNQAMAMITRLQEEKAALNMEALQCLRMMEEQAEYDSKALQEANDILAEKEKQIRNFDYELGLYRNQFGEILLSNDVVKPRPESVIEANYEKSDATTLSISDKDKDDITSGYVHVAHKMLDGYGDVGRMSLPQFEDEKRFILQNLRKLEDKLIMFSIGISHENGRMETNHLPRDTVMPREASEDLSGYYSQHENEGHDKFVSTIQVNREAELDEIRQELAAINSRIEALEAEQNVIECPDGSLEKGSEGFEILREIVGRIQELHLAYIRRSEDLR